MSADLDPRDELTDRLAALGRRPVDPALQSEHLTALAGVRSGSAFRTSLAGRAKLAAGVMAGFLIGATGLTTAGAMGPLQPIAADVVEAVAPVDVPKGKADEAKAKAAKDKAAHDVDGKGSIGTERDWAGCVAVEGGETFAGNRGRYLKQERAKGAEALAAAKASNCGKPTAADADDADAPEAERSGAGTESQGQNGAGNGNSAGKGRADQAGKPAEAGKSADAGKPAEVGSRPETVPAPAATEKANGNAKLPEPRTPGSAAGDTAADDTSADDTATDETPADDAATGDAPEADV